jgi:hypothetical protein
VATTHAYCTLLHKQARQEARFRAGRIVLYVAPVRPASLDNRLVTRAQFWANPFRGLPREDAASMLAPVRTAAPERILLPAAQQSDGCHLPSSFL